METLTAISFTEFSHVTYDEKLLDLSMCLFDMQVM